MTEPLSLTVQVPAPFTEAHGMTVSALKEEGFGVLTSIDIQSTFKEKLGVDFRQYVILGVCNPQLAHQALAGNAEAGLLLPCTVTIEAAGDRASVVRIANPQAMLQAGHFAPGDGMHEVAAQARGRLARVADRLAHPSA